MPSLNKKEPNPEPSESLPDKGAFPVHRRFIRHAIRLKIEFHAARALHAWTHNLSEDGVSFTLKEQLPIGRELTAWIYTGKGKGQTPLQVRCRVVWHEQTPKGFRHGVQFRLYTADSRERLAQLLANL